MEQFEQEFQLLGSVDREALIRMRGSIVNILEAYRPIHDKYASVEKTAKSIDELIRQIYERKTTEFLETGNFEDFQTMRFIFDLGEYLNKSLRHQLVELEACLYIAKTALRYSAEVNLIGNTVNIRDLQHVNGMLNESVKHATEYIRNGIFGFEETAKSCYKKIASEYAYLQKKYLGDSQQDSRIKRNPYIDDNAEIDFSTVSHLKIELINDNPLLTDLLLDIANILPKPRMTKQKIKGRIRKEKQWEEYHLSRTARILVELANADYQSYIRQPDMLLGEIRAVLSNFYAIGYSLEPGFRNLIEIEKKSPATIVHVERSFYERHMFNPVRIVSLIQETNFHSIKPGEYDIQPSNSAEKEYFAERKKLLNQILETIDKVMEADDWHEKVKIAREGIEKAAKLKDAAEELFKTERIRKLEKDIRGDKEFYVGTSGQLGAFEFKREAAPNIKFDDIVGKSYQLMKEHIEDLSRYNHHLHLYSATAPRGKIKSNMIAIGAYGCGKTEIGRAIASDERFIVGEVTVTDLLTAYFGEFEKNVDRVWDAANELRENSRGSKLVFLLMDEFDSWFRKSDTHWTDQTYMRVQKTIQMKLDGVVENEGIIVVGFTNEPNGIPLSIYRRFKYVDIVGELDKDERTTLLRKFLERGMPLSDGFTQKHYDEWSEIMDGATGDVIGKVADDIHYEFMRQFTDNHLREATKLEGAIKRAISRKGEPDREYLKRTLGKYTKVDPDWVHTKVTAKLHEPVIIEQIETAKRVYENARQIMANLHKRDDVMANSRTNLENNIIYAPREDQLRTP